jgi:hypothetical protein
VFENDKHFEFLKKKGNLPFQQNKTYVDGISGLGFGEPKPEKSIFFPPPILM